MFKGLGDLSSMMQQAREAQSKMKEAQERLASLRVEGSAGGGMVTIEMDGQQKVVGVRIEPALIADGDIEVLQDLVRSATNDALMKSMELTQQEMSEAMGGLNMPGLNDILGRLGSEQGT